MAAASSGVVEEVRGSELRAWWTEKRAKWERLCRCREERRGSVTLARDLIECNESSEPVFGAHVAIGRPRVNTISLLSALSGCDERCARELRTELELELAGDYSILAGALIAGDVPGFRDLPRNSQMAMIEGERRMRDVGVGDYSSAIVSYAKAVEVALREMVFGPFREQTGAPAMALQLRAVDLGKAAERVEKFLRFLEGSEHLELGSMGFVLRLTNGRTAARVPVLRLLGTFIDERKLGQTREAAWLDVLSNVASRYRNPAAHSDGHRLQDGEYVRDACCLLLRGLCRVTGKGAL